MLSSVFYLGMQGCLELGCVPEGVSWEIDVTPVDFAARAIVHVAVDQPQKGLGNVSEIGSVYADLQTSLSPREQHST